MGKIMVDEEQYNSIVNSLRSMESFFAELENYVRDYDADKERLLEYLKGLEKRIEKLEKLVN